MISLLFPALLLLSAPPAPPAPASGEWPTDAVLRTLAEGDAAQAAGDHARLFDTAQTLTALGATPAEGQTDLAAVWTQEAQDHGATRSALSFRGAALGPAYRRGSLAAGDSVAMHQLFLAGQRAQIAVAAPGTSGGLTVRVMDADGAMLCDKPVGPPQAECDWMPLFTDRYVIVIRNGGSSAAAFYLILR